MRRSLLASLAVACLVLGCSAGTVGPRAAAATTGPSMSASTLGFTPTSVSCWALLQCLIAGQDAKGVATLATWSPGGLTTVPTTGLPRGTATSSWRSISCLPGVCVAVGEVSTVPGWTTPLIGVERAGRLSASVVSVGVHGENDLNSVSCATTTSCVAVGDAATGIPASPSTSTIDQLTLTATGPSSTLVAHPAPGVEDSLDAVSCPTASQCVAVGASYAGGTSSWTPLLEQLTSGTWSTSSTGLTSGFLTGVSCPSTTWCTAVGSTTAAAVPGARPLVASWSGTTWTPGTISATNGILTSVSCAAPMVCRSVGALVATAGTKPLTVVTGPAPGWVAQPAPLAPGSTIEALAAVSCLVASECHAVGTAQVTGTSTGVLVNSTVPDIISLSPTSGPSTGGSVVHISALNAALVTAVSFGTAGARHLKVLSPTTLEVTVPPHAPGMVAVYLFASGGVSVATSASTYSYLAPPTKPHTTG